MNRFPIKSVQVGKDTYGELHILSYLPETEFLQIGNYVSIAPDVHFILSGNHQTENAFHLPYSIIVNQWALSERQCEQRGRYNRR